MEMNCRSMTGSWFRSKRFRVEGAPSSLFAVLSPVKRVEEGLSPVRSRADEEGLPRGTVEEQRLLSSSRERREKAWERREKSEERHGDMKRRGDVHAERHRDVERQRDVERHRDLERREQKPYSSSVSSAYSSTVNRRVLSGFYF